MSKINIKVSLTCNESIIYNDHKFIGIKTSNEIKYKENDVMVTIKINENQIEIQRRNNEYKLDLIFIENKETTCLYELNKYGTIKLELFTKKIICDNHISIEYYINKQDELYKFDLYYEVI